MIKESNNNGAYCGFDGDLLGFIYDEIDPAERGRVTQHISGCAACEQEVVGLSGVRSAVAAWRRDSFDTMITPVMPAFDAGSKPGLFDSIAAWLGLAGRPGMIGVTFASLMVLAVISFVALRPTQETAVLDTPDDPAVTAKVPEFAAGVPTPGPEQPAAEVIDPVRAAGDKPARISEVSPNIRAKQMKIVSDRAPAKRPRAPQLDNLVTAERHPVRLVDFTESEDESLRLAELLAELDAG